MKKEGIIHASFRPLSRRDLGLFAGSGVLLVLAGLAFTVGGRVGLILGGVLSLTGIVVFVYARSSRSGRELNEV